MKHWYRFIYPTAGGLARHRQLFRLPSEYPYNAIRPSPPTRSQRSCFAINVALMCRKSSILPAMRRSAWSRRQVERRQPTGQVGSLATCQRSRRRNARGRAVDWHVLAEGDGHFIRQRGIADDRRHDRRVVRRTYRLDCRRYWSSSRLWLSRVVTPVLAAIGTLSIDHSSVGHPAWHSEQDGRSHLAC